jgi:hypothetical protein
MKKLFAILAVLSLLMVPCVSMASTMSDSDLADVTGQMGVTIVVSNLNLGIQMGEILCGDADGFSDASFAGYVNMITPLNYSTTPFTMHVGVQGLAMTIDVGTYNTTNLGSLCLGLPVGGKTAVKIGINALTVTIDAIAFAIFLNGDKGADWDYASSTGGSYNWATSDAGYYQNSKMGLMTASSKGGSFVDGLATNSALFTDCLGVFGVSHIRATVSDLTILIMAH